MEILRKLTEVVSAIRNPFGDIADADILAISKACGLLDKKTIKMLTPLADELIDFHPAMKDMLTDHQGVRKWEYGMMLYGVPSWEKMRVLDIGTGPSVLPMYLSKVKDAQVTILDLPRPYTIEFEKMLQRFSEADIVLKSGDMRQIPYDDNSFDIVTSISVIEHLSHSADHKHFTQKSAFINETKLVLSEMYRVIRPGGWLYLTSDAYIEGMAKSDAWARKLVNGNPYGAYSIDELHNVFIAPLKELGAVFPYPIHYDKSGLISSPRFSSYRSRYMTVFNLFAQKPVS